MDDLSVKIKGLKETRLKIERFSFKLADRITLLAVRSGANFMLKQVRAAAPRKTGRLRRAIKVKTSKINRRRRNGKVGVYLTVTVGKKRDDPKGAYYGGIVEGGQSKRRKVAGKYFIRSTYNRTKRRSAELIIRNIEAAGKKLAARL